LRFFSGYQAFGWLMRWLIGFLMAAVILVTLREPWM